MKRPFLPAALFMLLALWPMSMMRQSTANAGFQPKGFNSPVLQSEFMVSDQGVYDLFGADNSEARRLRTESIRQAHRYDNLFLCFYGLFLALFAYQAYRLTRQKRYLAMALVAVVAAVADFFENYTIVQVSQTLDAKGSDFSVLLKRLAIFTWLKWLSLALYFWILTQFLKKASNWGNIKNWFGKFLAFVCILSVVITVVAFLSRDVRWENGMAQVIPLVFFGLFIFCLVFQRKNSD